MGSQKGSEGNLLPFFISHNVHIMLIGYVQIRYFYDNSVMADYYLTIVRNSSGFITGLGRIEGEKIEYDFKERNKKIK